MTNWNWIKFGAGFCWIFQQHLALTVLDVCLSLICSQSTSTYSALEVSHFVHCTNLRLTYLLTVLTFTKKTPKNPPGFLGVIWVSEPAITWCQRRCVRFLHQSVHPSTRVSVRDICSIHWWISSKFSFIVHLGTEMNCLGFRVKRSKVMVIGQSHRELDSTCRAIIFQLHCLPVFVVKDLELFSWVSFIFTRPVDLALFAGELTWLFVCIELQELMGSLLYVRHGLENSPYAHLLDPVGWTEIADVFLRDACALLGLSVDSPLSIV